MGSADGSTESSGSALFSVETETVPCALCGGNSPRPLFRSRDLRYETTPRDEFDLVECGRCGLRYLNPRPTETALAAFYPESYYSHRPKERAREGGILRRLYPSRADRIIREKVGRAVRLLHPGGRFIEYGPSTGQFLWALSRKGFDGLGIERSESMARHIRENLGLPCYHPRDFAETAHDSVHLVVLWNVLEHLPDPAGFFRWAGAILLPRGSVLFSVPNASAVERSIFFRGDPCEDIPRHLYAYTPSTIRRLLEKEGFTEIRIDHVSRVAMSELQERTERALHARPGGRRVKKVLYTGFLLPLFWAGDRAAALLGRSHTMVVSARRPEETPG
jgi:2-polyprenyl-3-methyl-5-hydroxy-6-metoxy-1,4-benzoquinol methylase